jgi:hypothetical protein
VALKGTIKDFGIADIFQLIGQQAKTGVLVLNNDVDEVRVYFRDGTVIAADNSSRPEQMLLGNLMVHAGVLGPSDLEAALREQKRTLKRIGALVTEMMFTDAMTVTEFATLQMMETIHALFDWKQGTYQFESIDVQTSPEGIKPVRAETIVMNGIRMTDEWPGIRVRIPSYSWTVETVKPLPPPKERTRTDEFDLSSLGEGFESSASFDEIGPYERRVYELVGSGKTVQHLIDTSRIGEFETCRALTVLNSAGYVLIIKPPQPNLGDDEPPRKPIFTPQTIVAATSRVVVSAFLVVVAGILIAQVGSAPAGAAIDGTIRFSPTIVHRHVSESQVRVLRRALEVYRLQTGKYPEALTQLVDAGIVSARDIRFPYERPYFYRLDGGTPVLLPPIP